MFFCGALVSAQTIDLDGGGGSGTLSEIDSTVTFQDLPYQSAPANVVVWDSAGERVEYARVTNINSTTFNKITADTFRLGGVYLIGRTDSAWVERPLGTWKKRLD